MYNIKNLSAIFTGANGSQGLESGKEYNIELFKGLLNGEKVTFLRVIDSEMELSAYESLIAFLSNWTNIKTTV